MGARGRSWESDAEEAARVRLRPIGVGAVIFSQSCAIALGEDASLGVGDAHGCAAGEEMGVRLPSAGVRAEERARVLSAYSSSRAWHAFQPRAMSLGSAVLASGTARSTPQSSAHTWKPNLSIRFFIWARGLTFTQRERALVYAPPEPTDGAHGHCYTVGCAGGYAGVKGMGQRCDVTPRTQRAER
jgi:hypothetical protein